MASTTSEKATPEEIWKILGEISESQKELSESQKEFSESQRELFESQRRLSESQEKTDRQISELFASQERTDRQIQETKQSIRLLNNLFTTQWGKLMESLVKGDLIKLLNEKGIEVGGLSQEHSRPFNGVDYEFDVIAVNGAEVVVVEVKTTLRPNDVDHFIKKLKDFRKVFPEYQRNVIYGAVAYLKANQGSDKSAERKGLFIIRATGSSASIANKEGFQPKSFGL